MFAPTVVATPRTVSFTAPCPDCGRDTEWQQRLASSVAACDFTIACDCTVAA